MMMRVVIALIFLSMAAFQQANAQRAKPFPEVTVDDWNIQRERKEDDEVEGDEGMDLEFDLTLTSMDNKPNNLPEFSKVQGLFETNKDRLMAEAQAAGAEFYERTDVQVKEGFRFYTLEQWVGDILKYCPQSWRYQCKTRGIRLTCFYNFHNGRWEWCCPFFPHLVIKKCACCQCAILTSQYALVGQCRRRYTKKSFLAVCQRGGSWINLRFITKSLPTSCYCRIG